MPHPVPTNEDFYRELVELVEEQAQREGIEENQVLLRIYDIMDAARKEKEKNPPVIVGLDF